MYLEEQPHKKLSKKQEGLLINMERILAGEEQRTTLMIKNIPNKYDMNVLLTKINECHNNKFDFFHLPWDFQNQCNRGYAFINFLHPVFVLDFYEEYRGKSWKVDYVNSNKIVELKYAST